MNRRKLIGAVIITLAIVIFAAVTYIAVKYALPERSFTLKGVRHFIISGNCYISSSELLSMAGLDNRVPDKKISTAAVEKELASRRLIRSARLRRSGNTVILHVLEVGPYFRTIAGGKKYWFCPDGSLVPMDIEADFGYPFDECRERVSLRLAGTQLLEDPKMAAVILYAALRIEERLPHAFSEMRVDLRGNIQLVTRSGLVAKLGDAERLDEKLDVLPDIIRKARNTPNVAFLEYRVPNRGELQEEKQDKLFVVLKLSGS